MDGTRRREFRPPTITRRQALALGAGATVVGLAGCAPSANKAQNGGGGGGTVTFVSDQFQPVDEAEKMRKQILAGYDGKVNFVSSPVGPFTDRVTSQAKAGKGDIALIGGTHGDFAGFASDGLLQDLSDLAQELSGRNFNPDYLDLAKLGGSQVNYIPWMQATYIMVARKEAVDLLPAGMDVQALTYDQLVQWAKAVNAKQGGQKLGFPAHQDGLLKRFFQGHSYPSYTGGVNTTFTSADAVTMWNWMRTAWTQTNRQSPTYQFMQEPLQSGEVWIGWDHVARMIQALEAKPEDFVAFPSPIGPKGLGFAPVVLGLGIPKSASDPEAGKKLIRYLTQQDTQATTLRQVGFFPPTSNLNLPGDLNPGVRAEANAVQAQTTSPKGIPSLLPIGLKDKTEAYDDVFRTTFEAIVLKNRAIPATLQSKAKELQTLFDSVQAPCWKPDPVSSGTCQVG
ncbi:MAG TPA: ABC transporter substrate-binding protein [Alphaproteobacteria bacterium]|nr:ABC transporter substrate-binding protein [Alphaproteobacteria bacterium]